MAKQVLSVYINYELAELLRKDAQKIQRSRNYILELILKQYYRKELK